MKTLEQLRVRLQGLISFAKVVSIDDSGKVQRGQVRVNPDRLIDRVPFLAQFGFTSRPPKDSDAVLIFFSGDPSNGLAIATGSQATRMKGLADGDTCVHDARGQYLWFTKDGWSLSGGGCLITATGGVLTLKGAQIITDGVTRLNNGVKEVARSGDSTTRGDTLTGGGGSGVYS